MKIAPFGLAAFAAAFACPLPAAAQQTETLQVTGGSGQRSVTFPFSGPVGQSFTAFTDTITQVGWQFVTLNPGSPNTAFTFNLLAGETLVGTPLATATFTLPGQWTDRTPRWFDIALPDVAVTNGSVYSLVLTNTSNRAAIVVGPNINLNTGQFLGPDPYAGGRAFAGARPLFSNCPNTSASACDLNFRVTGTVLPAAVPEPSAWALAIMGFGVVGSSLRARRKTRVQLTFA